MATKAKTLQVKDKEKDDKAADAPEKDSPDAPSPLLDLSDAAVKKMIKQAKKRGFVTFDQLNEVLPSDTTSPEQIEDIMSMLSDMGINVSEAEDADSEEENKEEAEDETDNELVEVTQKAVTEVKKSEPGERTDDPVRMYLREMGTVELLSREGEIAIAKRIEAGREAMIAGLCESPLTFQAIIIWRDELNEGKIFLRDIIDLEATYAGPDAKNNMNPAMLAAPLGPTASRWRPPTATAMARRRRRVQAAPAHIAPPAAPPAPTPFRAAPAAAAEGESTSEAAADGDMDDDEFENQMSLAAIEAELKPKVVETFDKIADNYKKLRRLQEQDISNQLQNETLSPAQERKYKKLKDEIIVEVKSLRLNQARIDSLVEQLYDINKKLVSFEGRLLRLGDSHGVAREDFLRNYQGSELDPRWLNRVSKLSAKGWKNFVHHEKDRIKELRHEIQSLAALDRARDRRIPQDRARRAEGRARGAPGQEGNGRGQPSPRDLDRQEIHQPRPAVPRSDPGRQYRPDEGGRQIRISPRLQVLDLCDLVDPAGDHALDRRPGPHHPHSRAHDRDHQQDRAHLAPDAQRDRPRADAGRARRKARHAAWRRCARFSRSPKSRCRWRRRWATRKTSHLGDFIEDKNAILPIDAAIQSNLRETTTRVLASLTPREERVLRMRFGIGMNTDHTLEEVGQQFSVTRERIRQIEAKALRKLKHPSRSRKLRSFLDN